MPACPSCGEEIAEGARFCASCGTALAERPPAAEERKVVSVLFVDLVGFTGHSDGADPEDVRARLRPYHQRMRQEIERFGGTVEKFVGDAVMAVFGAPTSHEDDAERAVRSALRILEAIEELNEEHPGLDLAVRAAVNTGEAVVALDSRPAEGEGIATGDVVNTAARLQSAAPVGSVVVGAATRRATETVFEWEELEPIVAKGKAEPVPLSRAVRARMRFGIDLDTGPRAPFVGRDDDLALLRATYERTQREASVQLVTVTGEPGVGKTRLVGEFRDWVDARQELVYWRQGRCLPYGEGITYWALGEMVKAHAGILETDSPAEVEEKLRGVVERAASEADREWLVSRLRPLAGLDAQPGEREEAFAAWQRFLEAVAEQRPLILVFEDLHWADDALTAFIDHLVDWSSGVPMLVVCTARPELYERHAGWGGGKRNSTTIGLSPLTSHETAKLLGALLERAVLPAETQAALLERCGGNPLYAEEFVRMLDDRDLLDGGADVPVPDTVQALIAARLDTLPPERKALLHDAAVVGKVFWAGAVAAMGDRASDDVRRGLHELSRKELVRPARMSSVRDEAEYAFWHALVRDVAYGQIPRAARARKHRAAAEWMEAMAGERVADHAELLAHHYEQALELARAAGEADETEALLEPTRRFLRLAGERALRLDVVAATGYFARALELCGPDDPERARILLRQAPPAVHGPAEAVADLEDAMRIFRLDGDEVGVGEAMLAASKLEWLRGQAERADALLDEATVLLERHPPGEELAWAYGRLAGREMIAGRSRSCIEWSDRALELYASLEKQEPWFGQPTRNMRGCARCELDDAEGLVDLRESLETLIEVGPVEQTISAYCNLADWVWQLEGPEQALSIHREGIEFALRRGMRGPAEWSRAETTWMLFDLGRWDELLQVAAEVDRFDEAHGGMQQGLLGGSYAGHVHLRRGELKRATAVRDRYLERARLAQDPQVLSPALALHALVELARDASSAVAAIEEELDATRGLADWHRGRFLPELVRIAPVVLGRELLEPMRTTLGRASHAIVASRAELAEIEGKLEEARELHDEAAARWASYGRVDGRADSLLGAGRCLLALGRDNDGRERLDEARAIFQQLGAQPALVEIAELLGESAPAAREGEA